GPIERRRHEVDHAVGAAIAAELRIEDERLRPVSLRGLAYGRRGPDREASMLIAPEERREARIRVEARSAEPVDSPPARDERRGLRVADQPVVLDPGSHGALSSAPTSERSRRKPARQAARGGAGARLGGAPPSARRAPSRPRGRARSGRAPRAAWGRAARR